MSSAITANFALLEQAISQFDARFTLRVLRSISSTRRSPHFAEALSNAIDTLYASHPDAPSKHFLTTALGKSKGDGANGNTSQKPTAGEPLAEHFVYLAILVQVCLVRIIWQAQISNTVRSISMIRRSSLRARSTPRSWLTKSASTTGGHWTLWPQKPTFTITSSMSSSIPSHLRVKQPSSRPDRSFWPHFVVQSFARTPTLKPL